MTHNADKALALVVLLENVGHIHGLRLPFWLRAVIDFLSEAYAKALLHLYGAYQRYDRVVILEDERATDEDFVGTLLELSPSYRVDLLLLVHGLEQGLVGYRGQPIVSAFDTLLTSYKANPDCLDLRTVYGINCHGQSLISRWHALGAKAVSGASGVNWFPEPALSGFLWSWLRGHSFSASVARANRLVARLGGWLFGLEHVAVQSSLQRLSGDGSISISSSGKCLGVKSLQIGPQTD